MIHVDRGQTVLRAAVAGALVAIFAIILGIADRPLAQPAARSWLDKTAAARNGAPIAAWNRAGAAVPPAPRREGAGSAADAVRCRDSARRPTLAPDRALADAGWTLFGPAQIFGRTTILKARSAVDGMCRPLGYQVFVFYDGQFAGTLSPVPMDARTDGAETDVRLLEEDRIVAEFARYTPADALCCPSARCRVTYAIEHAADAARVLATDIAMERTDAEGAASAALDAPLPPPDTAWGKMTGSVALGQGVEVPPNATLRITLRNLSQPDNRDAIIAERALACCEEGRMRFELEYDPLLIEDEDEYAVLARVSVGGELVLSTGYPQRVITGGRPKQIDLVLERVPK